MAHYADDGDSFYYEYSCLYKTDAYTDGEAESPATYAHEILHLFGAPDLYEGSSDPYVDEALVSYVADTYPGDIMLSTYEDDGSSRFDAITKEISPLTAYCLGAGRHLPRACAVPPVGRHDPRRFLLRSRRGSGERGGRRELAGRGSGVRKVSTARKLLSPRRCCASPLAEGGGPQGRRERTSPLPEIFRTAARFSPPPAAAEAPSQRGPRRALFIKHAGWRSPARCCPRRTRSRCRAG